MTTGLPVEDARLKGADFPADTRVWPLETANGLCRLPFVKSPDPRFRKLVKSFAEAGCVGTEQDEFAGAL
jgi:hypothetical protein